MEKEKIIKIMERAKERIETGENSYVCYAVMFSYADLFMEDLNKFFLKNNIKLKENFKMQTVFNDFFEDIAPEIKKWIIHVGEMNNIDYEWNEEWRYVDCDEYKDAEECDEVFYAGDRIIEINRYLKRLREELKDD